MSLLFSMSLAGSLVLILYFATKSATKRFLPASWRYHLLKISLLFYLLPYQCLKYIYTGIGSYLFPSRHQIPDPQVPFCTINANRIIVIDSDGRFNFENQTVILTILGIWGILAIAFLLYNIKKYACCMKDLQQITNLPFDLPNEQHVSKRHSKAEISLYENQYITTPFTLGLFSPRIILPVSLADGENSQMIIAHEMAHVRNHDNLVKFLWLIALILHWYNPAIYVLYWEICKVSEQVCDASVTQGMSKQEIKQYQSLIIDMSQKKTHMDTLLASSFSGKFRMIKERISVMNRTTSSKKIYIVTSLVMAVVILALSPISVLAYSPTLTGQYQDEQFSIKGENLTVYLGQNIPGVYDPFLEYGTAHDIFVATDGQAYMLNDSDPQMERAICFHNWQDGMTYDHVKNDDGSCVVYYYSCQCCTNCGSLRNITYDSEHRYLKCPH